MLLLYLLLVNIKGDNNVLTFQHLSKNINHLFVSSFNRFVDGSLVKITDVIDTDYSRKTTVAPNR